MQLVLANYFKFSQRSTYSFDISKNYYEILKIKQNSSKGVIRNAYLTLAKKYHPDVNKKGKQQFTLIRQAYQVLSNEKSKTQFDIFYSKYINTAKESFKDKSSYYKNTADQQKQQFRKNYHYRNQSNNKRETDGFNFKGQQKMYNSDWNSNYYQENYDQTQHYKTYQYKGNLFDLFKQSKKWKEQFQKAFESPKQKPKSKQQNKKKSKIDEQYKKVQHMFSSRNPFSPQTTPQRNQQSKYQEMDIKIKDIWHKLRNKFSL